MIKEPRRFSESWDLDQIFVNEYQYPWDLERALTAFNEVVELCRNETTDLLASLIIHLVQSPILEIKPPVFESLNDLDIDVQHPPSLLVQKAVHPDPPATEMFRLPIEIGNTYLVNNSVHAYYVSWRSRQAQRLGEVYDREMVISYRG